MSDVESEPVVIEEPVAVPKTKKARKKAAKVAEPEVEAPAPTKKGRKKVAAKVAAEPEPVAPVKKARGKKMEDDQKKMLNDHMATKKGVLGEGAETRSHRMKLMGRMLKGMTLDEALKDIA